MKCLLRVSVIQCPKPLLSSHNDSRRCTALNNLDPRQSLLFNPWLIGGQDDHWVRIPGQWQVTNSFKICWYTFCEKKYNSFYMQTTQYPSPNPHPPSERAKPRTLAVWENKWENASQCGQLRWSNGSKAQHTVFICFSCLDPNDHVFELYAGVSDCPITRLTVREDNDLLSKIIFHPPN